MLHNVSDSSLACSHESPLTFVTKKVLHPLHCPHNHPANLHRYNNNNPDDLIRIRIYRIFIDLSMRDAIID